MPYEVLALKYRPKVFEDLIGQEAVTRTLTNAIQQDRIAHAFLFSGVRGVGKTTTARILAKALNCERGPTVRPCGECAACQEIARGSALDVLEIDGASNNGVEQVREIVEASRYAPSRDRFKIYIIDEVHMLSTAAFNALLKTLEEPPSTVKFIFATTEHHKIPDTILSRCQEFEFRTVSPAEIASQLQSIATAEGITIEEAAVRALARAASGSLRDGISALDQVIAASSGAIEEKDVTELLGLIERDVLRTTMRALVQKDTAAVLRIVDELQNGGRDLRYFTSALMQYIRDVLVAKVAPDAAELVELPGETADLAELASQVSEEDLLRALDVLTETETTLRTAPEPRFHLEVALLKIAQLQRLASFEELLERFEALAGGSSSSSSPPSGAPPVPGAKPEPARSTRASSGGVPSKHRATSSAPPRAPSGSEGPAWMDEAPPVGDLDVEPASAPSPGKEPLVGRLVERLKTSKPMLHALVSRHHEAVLDGDRLTLRYQEEQSVFVEQLQQSDTLAALETHLSELAERKLAVAVELNGADDVDRVNGESSTAPSEPAAKEPTGERGPDLLERARRDGLIRQFVDTFQGEIESVRPANDKP